LLEIIKFVCGLLVLLTLIELLNLPELIGKKIRGVVSKKELKEKMEDIEKRLEKN